MAKYLDSDGVSYLWGKIKSNTIKTIKPDDYCPVTVSSSKDKNGYFECTLGLNHDTSLTTFKNTDTDETTLRTVHAPALTKATDYTEYAPSNFVGLEGVLSYASLIHNGLITSPAAGEESIIYVDNGGNPIGGARGKVSVYTFAGGTDLRDSVAYQLAFAAQGRLAFRKQKTPEKDASGVIVDGWEENWKRIQCWGEPNYASLRLKDQKDNVIGSYAGDVEVSVKLSDGLSSSLDLGTKTVSISVDSKWVNGLINNKLAVADALIFKGVVNTPTPAGSTGLPGVTGYKPGWTYKVAKAGTYAGNTCEVGDMIIAVTEYKESTASNADWTVIQNNVDIAGKDTLGLVKTTSTVTNNSGYTATPIIDGVPYYKDTNTSHEHAAGDGIALTGRAGTSGETTTIALKNASTTEIGGGKVGIVLGESAGTVDKIDSYVTDTTDYKYVKIAMDNSDCLCAAYPLAMSDVDIDNAILEGDKQIVNSKQ